MTTDEIKKHEEKILEFIRNNKILEAIKYRKQHFPNNPPNYKSKVKEMADANGLSSNYNSWQKTRRLKDILQAAVLIILFLFILKSC